VVAAVKFVVDGPDDRAIFQMADEGMGPEDIEAARREAEQLAAAGGMRGPLRTFAVINGGKIDAKEAA
jgi:hypothetical protein